MLEEIGETLGSVGRSPWHTGRDRSRDEEELAFDGGRHLPGPPLDHGVEASDRVLEAPHHGDLGVPTVPEVLERDDLSHGPIMRPPSDTPGRSPVQKPDEEHISAYEAECVKAVRAVLRGDLLWDADHAKPIASPLARGRIVRSIALSGWWPDTMLVANWEESGEARAMTWSLWKETELWAGRDTPEIEDAWLLSNIIVSQLEEP
jgi:hypothetical protein